MSTTITFSSPLWRYSAGKGSWYFVTLPKEDSEFIKRIEEKQVVGFGFIRVRASVENSTWETTLFPSKEYGSYLLSINTNIRNKENILVGSIVTVQLSLI